MRGSTIERPAGGGPNAALDAFYLRLAGGNLTGKTTVGGAQGIELDTTARLAVAAVADSTALARLGDITATARQFNVATGNVFGLRVQVANHDKANVYGAHIHARLDGLGPSNVLRGISTDLNYSPSAASTLTETTGIIISPLAVGPNGTITNAYGLRILAQKTAAVGTGYGITQEGTADLNTFAGATSLNGDATIGGAGKTIGFFGGGRVARQTVDAAATDAATTQALVNTIRTALINLNLAA